jgi:hypothetical protein
MAFDRRGQKNQNVRWAYIWQSGTITVEQQQKLKRNKKKKFFNCLQMLIRPRACRSVECLQVAQQFILHNYLPCNYGGIV